ncbi:hypothetical protein DTL21_27970 [Bremerella cremea]|uniref:Uncharacterized protein n=1 Tax=Blastopirellula marina TaxID=124 RepID=A0A2S8F8F7_9BACT|nr:hypothetical protein C5Y83_27925 [Blastopirellula marina]RCS41812.1 hypothetical protein DTL21_27970 [Bremerella cremea]
MAALNEDRDVWFVTFNEETYRRRNIVERLIGWLKECRNFLTRFENQARNFLRILEWSFTQRNLKTLG